MAAQIAIDCIQASRQGAALLSCPTELVRGKETEFLSAALPLAESSGLILDMSEVESLDAGGIGTLMILRQVAERGGHSLVLTDPSPRVAQILSLVGLDQILVCHPANA